MRYVEEVRHLLFEDEKHPDWRAVRRARGGQWCRLMGESWEAVSDGDGRLEAEYQEIVAKSGCPDMDYGLRPADPDDSGAIPGRNGV